MNTLVVSQIDSNSWSEMEHKKIQFFALNSSKKFPNNFIRNCSCQRVVNQLALRDVPEIKNVQQFV
jgi:hypothetical protein